MSIALPAEELFKSKWMQILSRKGHGGPGDPDYTELIVIALGFLFVYIYFLMV